MKSRRCVTLLCSTPLWGVLAACSREQPADEGQPRSRVQAVLSEPGAEPAAPKVEPSAEPARGARPPLCAGQLAVAPSPFRPRALPERRAASGARELAKDPLARNDARSRWVNFWAAWCVPCKQELPLLLDWQRKLHAELDVTFVSLDDDERQLLSFLEAQPPDGLRSTYWLPDGAVRNAWLQALGLEAEPELPLQLLLDESGQLRCRVQGAVEAGDFAELGRIVRR